MAAKMAEPIEMPLGLWARMGPKNHVLQGDPQVLIGRYHGNQFLAFDGL